MTSGIVEDLTGQVIGDYKIVKLDNIINGKGRIWECICLNCDMIVKRSTGILNQRKPHKCQHTDKQQAINIIWSRYKIKADKRNIPFLLTKDVFGTLIFDKCYYCGNFPTTPINYKNKILTTYNGIDRINSDDSYKIDNCVTCCWICNRAKGSLSKEQFMAWMRSAAQYNTRRISNKTIGELIDNLMTETIKCFMAQEDIVNAPENSKKALSAAKRAQELNAKRNRLLRSIDILLGFEEDTPSEKTYA